MFDFNVQYKKKKKTEKQCLAYFVDVVFYNYF